jgi:hypothetical protein
MVLLPLKRDRVRGTNIADRKGISMSQDQEVKGTPEKSVYYLGIASLVAWLIPLVGIPVSVLGLIRGQSLIHKTGEDLVVRKGMKFAGIGLILSIANGVLGVIFNSMGLI